MVQLLEHIVVRTEQEARALLGKSIDAVVLDGTSRLNADALGLAHGAIRAGGALIVLLSDRVSGTDRFAVEPHTTEDTRQVFVARFLERLRVLGIPVLDPGAARPRFSPSAIEADTADQRACVRALVDHALEHTSPIVVRAHRGRGKSVALGRAAFQLRALGRSVIITGPSESAAAEAVRFGEAAYAPPAEAARAGADVLFVDEAAAIPVPLLRPLLDSGACLALATTLHGYEGTGRGFRLRVVPMLRAKFGEIVELTLEEPIRFAANDPLERAVFDLLALDASAASPSAEDRTILHVDRDALARDETMLRELFGLLVDAHYRTTPSDLERMLDAPNLEVLACRDRSAVALVAREGRLSRARCAALYEGRSRIRGHALAELFVCHLGIEEAGALDIARVVRVAVHPDRRRRALGRELADAAGADADIAGALFGADPDIARFWLAAGFSLVHVGTARGARTGAPSLGFARGRSDAGKAIVARASARAAAFGRWYGRDPAFDLDPELARVLGASLGEASAPDPSALVAYAFGPRPFETVLPELELASRDRALGPILRMRVRERLPWPEVARRAGLPLKTAMRRARVEAQELVERPATNRFAR
jgi:tRNA(Met) cytidine acetyltransferase